MKTEVSKEAFYNALKNENKDIIYNVENEFKYPYNGIFKERKTGKMWGYIEATDKDKDGKRIYPHIETFYLYK